MRLPDSGWSLIWGGLLILGLGRSATAAEPRPELGLGLALAIDRPDRIYSRETASFSPGPSTRLPLRIPLGQGAWFRTTLAGSVATGHDRVEWEQQDGVIRYESHDHPTLLTASSLLVGPELGWELGDRWRPFAGADVGATWAQSWHGFGGATDVLLGDDSHRATHPWSSALAAAAGAHAGVLFRVAGPFALEVETGYTVSFVQQAPLRGAPDRLNAVRSAFGLNVAHIGVAATFELGKKAR